MEERPPFSPRDVVAGLSVALLLIPQAMAYADLAGVPPHVGLYAAGLPLIAAAFAASSPYLQTGPVALTGLLTLGAIVPLAAPRTEEYVALAILLALIVGLVRLAVGLFRAGWVAFLMSQPVLAGFTSAAAILILASQLPGALGTVDAPAGGVVYRAFHAAAHPGSWEPESIGLSVATIAVIVGARKIHPLVPGVLIATVGGLAFSVATHYGGPVIGSVPTGFPAPRFDLPWRAIPVLVAPGLVIALVGFAEPASIARALAAEGRQRWDPSREFVSQGLANLASGLSGGLPVGGSFSRSSVNRMAGARTRWSGAVTGVAVLAFLPAASILAPLPRAVLAAIVLAAVSSMVEFRPLVAMFRHSRLQAMVGWSTFGLTLLLAPRIDQAVLIGIALALGVHAWREMRFELETWTEGRTLHLRPEGVLWFGSAPVLEEQALSLLEPDGDTRRIVVHLERLGRIDYTGALGLADLVADAARVGVDIEFVDVPGHAERIMGHVLGWVPTDAPPSS